MRFLRRLRCLLVGHDWKRVGETYRGFEQMPRLAIWKCTHCRREEETSAWTRPTQ